MELAEAKFLNAFNAIPGVGAATLRALKKHFGSYQTAWRAHESAYASAHLDATAHTALIVGKNSTDPDREMRKLAQGNIWMMTEENPGYPAILKEITAPPVVLYGRGNPDALVRHPHIAVVGTRRPTSYGLEAAETIIPRLTDAGISIVSGLATGIDTKAHQIALEEKAVTVAVLGSGIDPVSIFPPENRGLAERIASSGGAVISEYSPGTPAAKEHFPVRNRIISGLSQGTLVVEAREKSGALITARFALEQNREVFAIPGSIFSATSRGPLSLIREGAIPATGAHDILEALGIDYAPKKAEALNAAGNPDARMLLELLCETRSIDALKIKTGLPIETIMASLSLLELKGYIHRVGADMFQKREL